MSVTHTLNFGNHPVHVRFQGEPDRLHSRFNVIWYDSADVNKWVTLIIRVKIKGENVVFDKTGLGEVSKIQWSNAPPIFRLLIFLKLWSTESKDAIDSVSEAFLLAYKEKFELVEANSDLFSSLVVTSRQADDIIDA